MISIRYMAMAGAMMVCAVAAATEVGADPFGSGAWPDLRREFFGTAPLRFDARVSVQGPAFAEDPMNVPISVSVEGLDGVEALLVLVDRNPIRKVLEFFPLDQPPRLSFRFKLEQASPVRVAARTRDGVWHVGGVQVDSAGGGCTVAGASRRDGSWSERLGAVDARLFARSAGARLRLRVTHPMDTGLVAGIPAFHVNRLALVDGDGAVLLRLHTFEPVSENPVFSFDLARRPVGAMRLVGSDNNGNRIDADIDTRLERSRP